SAIESYALRIVHSDKCVRDCLGTPGHRRANCRSQLSRNTRPVSAQYIGMNEKSARKATLKPKKLKLNKQTQRDLTPISVDSVKGGNYSAQIRLCHVQGN